MVLSKLNCPTFNLKQCRDIQPKNICCHIHANNGFGVAIFLEKCRRNNDIYNDIYKINCLSPHLYLISPRVTNGEEVGKRCLWLDNLQWMRVKDTSIWWKILDLETLTLINSSFETITIKTAILWINHFVNA